jgi:hypothetical protein
MKKITNKTLLKQGNIIYQPVITDEGVIGWYDIIEKWIVAQAENVFIGVPVISTWGFLLIKPTEYTLEDIVKAIELARTTYIQNGGFVNMEVDQYSTSEIIEQINSISIIEVDEQFNIIGYE